jgi:hypothetical protein
LEPQTRRSVALPSFEEAKAAVIVVVAMVVVVMVVVLDVVVMVVVAVAVVVVATMLRRIVVWRRLLPLVEVPLVPRRRRLLLRRRVVRALLRAGRRRRRVHRRIPCTQPRNNKPRLDPAPTSETQHTVPNPIDGSRERCIRANWLNLGKNKSVFLGGIRLEMIPEEEFYLADAGSSSSLSAAADPLLRLPES